MSANGEKLNRLGQTLTKNSNNNFVRGQYFNLKYKYKPTCKKEKRKFERELLQNRENIYTSNNDEFWNLLRQIKRSSANKIYEHQIFLTLTDLNKHSKELLQKYCNWTEHKLSEPLSTNQLIL